MLTGARYGYRKLQRYRMTSLKVGEGCVVKKLVVSVLGIGMIVGARAAIVQAGDHGSNFIHTETVGQSTTGAPAFGPVGANCDVSTGGTACAYLNLDFTGSGTGVPLCERPARYCGQPHRLLHTCLGH